MEVHHIKASRPSLTYSSYLHSKSSKICAAENHVAALPRSWSVALIEKSLKEPDVRFWKVGSFLELVQLSSTSQYGSEEALYDVQRGAYRLMFTTLPASDRALIDGERPG
jgi:hypothetical protein